MLHQSSVIQVMVGANGPVRGPHPMQVCGKSVKDDSSPVRGPHPIRASGQEKEIQGGMVGKKSDGAAGLVADVMLTSDPWSPLDVPLNLSLNVIRYAARYAR